MGCRARVHARLPVQSDAVEQSVPALSPTRARSAPLFCAAALALLAFHLVGTVFLDGFALDLGSTNFPTLRYLTFIVFWAPFGGLAAALLALAVSRRFGSPAQMAWLAGEWNAVSERRFLLWTSAAAFAIPLVVRLRLLQGAPLTDDEGAYRFAAQLLATGRLWVASPAMKVFFDQNFMINDGRLYPVYFLGWPALLAPAVWIGMPGIMNPILSAFTVLPLSRALRQFVGPSWARAGVLLFLSAPFIQIAAATLLAHTSCLMALTWCLWLYLRTQRDDASVRDHAGFAGSFALAFCIRPQSALPIGLPLVVSWAWTLRHRAVKRRMRAVLAFLVPAAALAALFLGSLWAQNGAPWRPGYAEYNRYAVENHFRFTSFGARDFTTVAGFDFSQIGAAIARTAVGMFRLSADLFGWPSSFALILLALPVRTSRTRVLWWMFGSYVLLLLFQRDWGIDTFGPMHAFELSLPILALTIAGAKDLSERLIWARSDGDAPPSWQWSIFSPALLGALIVTAWAGFVPVRLEAVRRIAAHVNTALQAPERANLHHAVIFAPLPFAPPCHDVPEHFVLFRPVNDPDLRNDILWVNHVNIEDDRHLVESLGGRTGYVLQWTPACDVTLRPLATLAAGDVPPATGRMRR